MKTSIPQAILLLGTFTFPAIASDGHNVLIIYTDEHNFRTLEAYQKLIPEGQRYPWGNNVPLETPNINYLAEKGVLMNNCYVTSPVSTPSRASLMTGLYAQKTSAPRNNMVLDTSLTTIAHTFGNNGYKTGYIGKWHLSGEAKPGWNPAHNYGWQENFYMLNRGHYKSIKDSQSGGVPIVPNSESALLAGYEFSTDYFTRKAQDFIQRNKTNPFLLLLSIPDPHGPDVVSAPYYEKFKTFNFLKPATASKKMSDYPSWASGNTTLNQDVYRSYWGMVKCIDDNIGKVIATLRENDLLDKTIIVFTSDHGDMCGEHGRVDKSVPLEASLKVPFIVYAPSIIAQNLVVNEAVSNIDLFPTLADLCKLNGMPQIDGTSIAPLLKNIPGYRGLNMVFSRSTGDDLGWIAATTDRYKLVVSSSANDMPWLTDKAIDPDELINYYSHPDYAAIKDTLRINLIKYCETHNETKIKNAKIRSDLGMKPSINDNDTIETGFVRNGTFDEGAAHWKLSNTDIVFESSVTTAINGVTCRMPGVSNGRNMSQEIELTPDMEYEFRFTGRIQNAVGASGSQINNHTTNGVATLSGEVFDSENKLLLLLVNQEPKDKELSGKFYLPSGSEQVTVRLSKNWNVAYIDNVKIHESATSGVNEAKSLSMLQLHKTDKGFRIENKNNSNKIQLAMVYDISGKIIRKFIQPEKIFDVTPLLHGLYIIVAIFENGEQFSNKFLF